MGKLKEDENILLKEFTRLPYMLAYHCINRNPKARPLMRDIVDSLEPLQAPTEDVSTEKTTLTVISEAPDAESKGKEDA